MTAKQTDPDKRPSDELTEDQLQGVSGGSMDDMPDLAFDPLADPRPSPLLDPKFGQGGKVEKGEK